MMVALSVKISESKKLYPMYMSRLANQRAQSTDMTSLMPLATAAIPVLGFRLWYIVAFIVVKQQFG
mgnify:CR=1 FL=1